MSVAPPGGPTRAEIQARRRAVAAAAKQPRGAHGAVRSPKRWNRADKWLAIVAVVLVLVAAGIGVLTFLTVADAQDARDANASLEARVASLHANLAAADKAIDDLSALFIAIKAQNDATAAAVTATNKAAEQYNNAEAGITDALGTEGSAALAALVQATTVVKAAAAHAQQSLAALGGDGSRR